jgi:eukaryotic-like serine/threonine-protein kinase
MAGAREAQHVFAGRYRRIRGLGSGGMARVFLAEDEVLGREVAIKQLPSSSPQEALARFRREARLGASLNHPGIVSIFDSVSDEDSVLIVMEYVEGESLAERLRRGPLTTQAATSVLEQVADALDHAHRHGVVHRDVKPSNILIATDRSAKLADLGIATATDATAITGSGDVIGTLAYIAPERLRGEAGGAPADVYSLAAVAFEMLCGRRAHPEQTPAELLRRIDAGAVPDLLEADPGASPGAAELLSEAMASDPGARPRSAGKLVRRLESELERPPFVPPAPAPRGSSAARLPALAAIGAVAALLLAAVLFSAGGGEPGPTAADAPPGAGARDGSGSDFQPGNDSGASAAPAAASAEPPSSPSEPAAPAADAASPSGPSALNERGFALIQQGSYEEAIPLLQEAVDSADPSSLTYAYALFNLGNALRLAGRPEEAIPILEERLQIPDQTGVVRRELELAYAAAGVEGPGGEGGNGKGKAKGKDKKQKDAAD